MVILLTWPNLENIVDVHVQNLESVDCCDTGEFDELGNSGKYGS